MINVSVDFDNFLAINVINVSVDCDKLLAIDCDNAWKAVHILRGGSRRFSLPKVLLSLTFFCCCCCWIHSFII